MTDMPNTQNLRGARVTVIGLGIEGIDLVRFLAAEGARVTVSDMRTADQLQEALRAIEGCDATPSLGANRVEDVIEAEAVFVSQGVPSTLPAMTAARERGIPMSSMLQLFLERCPAPVTGITGSSGKTTTTSLTGAMLHASGQDYVVGGNIGVGLLSLLPEITPTTRVVAEMSHSQLERVNSSPHVACVTNVTPNHLDRYSWDAYIELKRNIVRHQRPGDIAVLNHDDDISRSFADSTPARIVQTSRFEPIPGDGAVLHDGILFRVLGGKREPIVQRTDVTLRGDHNIENLLLAMAVASQIGCSAADCATTARTFTGVLHRLEPVETVRGVLWVNDSIATTPERTLAGLRAYREPLVLIVGGRDKYLPNGEMAAEAVRRCRAVVAFGESGDLYAEAVREAAVAAGSDLPVRRVDSVEDAVAAASTLAREGDVVLFSPAGTSFDRYRNFEERGEAFRVAVRSLAGGR
ncbi:MAG: UDP-N-acetylmuramoyl-L-alanine--D-glutamate ligase [Dehalococcoidia bacterium]|nr:MAG: UDP-N-acetylmuramoyl-L-alanine--D-glutamate ligase [Dehalococcoidia bacterium]